MVALVKNEIIGLHQFFQDWYNSQLEPTYANFSRCADVLAPDFTIIFPSGEMVHRQPLINTLWKAHHSQDDMRIWIENIQVLNHQGELILACYEEWQEIEGKVTVRLSSVLFREVPTAPNGLVWLHVHETWTKRERNI